MALRLIKLSPEYKDQLQDMMGEWLSVEQEFSPYAIRRFDYRDFDTYLANLETKEETEDRIPDSVFFALDEERNIFVGAVNIRHYLNDYLCHTGGHIGDGIRPSERRKSYATEMIGLALEECKKLGMNKVLMTCDKDNIGSAKSIMNNGGVLEFEVEEDGVLEQRYWITLHEEIVETERCILKREMPSDYTDAFAWSGDERVYKYLLSNPVKRAEDMIPWLERQDPNSKERYVMIIRSKEDNHPIGTVGIFYDSETDVWSIAYNIRYDEWGKGYAMEATQGMMNYVQNQYDAREFEAECAAQNNGSRRVIEKLGFTFMCEGSYTKHGGNETFPSRIYRKHVR